MKNTTKLGAMAEAALEAHAQTNAPVKPITFRQALVQALVITAGAVVVGVTPAVAGLLLLHLGMPVWLALTVEAVLYVFGIAGFMWWLDRWLRP